MRAAPHCENSTSGVREAPVYARYTRTRPPSSVSPRIYNLLPLPVGPVAAWEAQLPPSAAMGFNWVLLNPFHVPGGSGSLYAVKDDCRLNPLLRRDGDASADRRLAHFTAAAERAGLALMMDLVVNHMAGTRRWCASTRAGPCTTTAVGVASP